MSELAALRVNVVLDPDVDAVDVVSPRSFAEATVLKYSGAANLPV